MSKKLPFSYATRRKRRTVTELYIKQNGRCIYCKKQMWLPWDPNDMFSWIGDENDPIQNKPIFKSRATIEHKKPKVHGGTNYFNKANNLVCSCLACNSKKSELPHWVFTLVHNSDMLYKLTTRIRRKYFYISRKISSYGKKRKRRVRNISNGRCCS